MLDTLQDLRKRLQKFRSGFDDLGTQLEGKLQRLAYLEEAPLPASDVADIVCEQMCSKSEAVFKEHLDSRLAPLVSRPMKDVSNWWPMLLANRGAPPYSVDAMHIFWLLREPITTAIRELILNHPELQEAGPPRAERLIEIAELEQEIEQLRASIDEQRQMAKELGLDAAQVHQRERPPARTRDLKR